jgi:nitroreductase
MTVRSDSAELRETSSPGKRFRARYGNPTLGDPEVWSDVVDHLLDHRSVRRFLRDPVTEAQLRTITAAAQSAPSSSNLHAWSVVAVTDPALRERLAELVGDQPAVRAAPLQLVWLADLSMLDRLSQAKDFPVTGLDYLEMFVIGAIDASLAAQNASTAAESLGLATVYIGGIRNRIEEVAQLLGLPPRAAPVFGMCVGTPDPNPPTFVKPRPPQSVVLHRNRYDAGASVPGLLQYELAMAKFYESQGMKVESWIMRSLRRVATPQALTGRDRLRKSLQQMGFPLT